MASDEYLKKKTLVKQKLSKVKIFNFTTDCWTSVQNFSYISLTSHFLDENFSLSSIVLAIRHIVGGHSSNNMCEKIKEIMNEFEVEQKSKFITTDNAKSMVQMAEKLNLIRIPCIAHILHLIVTNTFKSIKENCSKETNNESDLETEYVAESHPYFKNENLLSNEKESLKLNSKTTFLTYPKEFSLFNFGNIL